MRSYWKVKTKIFILLFLSKLFQLSSKPNFQTFSFSLLHNKHPFHLFLIYLSRPTILENIIPLPRLLSFLLLLDHLVLCKPVQNSPTPNIGLFRTVFIKVNEHFLWANLFFFLITSSSKFCSHFKVVEKRISNTDYRIFTSAIKILNKVKVSVIWCSMKNLNQGVSLQIGKEKVDKYFRYMRWR